MSNCLSIKNNLSSEFSINSGYEVFFDLTESYGKDMGSFLNGIEYPCYVAFSPDTVFVNPSRIMAILDWAANHSSDIVVIEGTYLKRWNLLGIEGKSEQEAQQIVRQQSHKIRARIQKVINVNSWEHRIKFVNWEHIISLPRYSRIHYSIKDYYEHHWKFQNLVHLEVQEFLFRQQTRVLQNIYKLRIYLANYVLEEIVMFIYLYLRGYEIEIYPGGELNVMRKIVEHSFPDFPVDISSRTHISLQVHHPKTMEQ